MSQILTKLSRVMEAIAEDLDQKVARLLITIRDSKGNIAEMHEHKKHLSAIDALHASLSDFEIISFDKDFDKIDVERIWI